MGATATTKNGDATEATATKDGNHDGDGSHDRDSNHGGRDGRGQQGKTTE